MRTRPTDLADDDISNCLLAGWGLNVARLEYVAVGGGSHHWLALDAAGRQHWVTIDHLANHGFLGDTPADACSGLRSALDTARALREMGLEFVVAPRRSNRGATIEPLGARYAVAVYPYLAGTSGKFGVPLPPTERALVIDMLVRLHQATPGVAARARPWPLAVASRGGLEEALDDLDHPWAGGPFAEPARELVASRATVVRRLLATFDGLAAEVGAAAIEPVITHGEPHPANFIHADGRLFMVDWDTVGLGPPERDLWMISTAAGDELARYTDLSGRRVNPAALRLYRLRWLVDDISLAVGGFRSTHAETADITRAWQFLTRILASPHPLLI
jgi:spectinomycin phosphotransferase